MYLIYILVHNIYKLSIVQATYHSSIFTNTYVLMHSFTFMEILKTHRLCLNTNLYFSFTFILELLLALSLFLSHALSHPLIVLLISPHNNHKTHNHNLTCISYASSCFLSFHENGVKYIYIHS